MFESYRLVSPIGRIITCSGIIRKISVIEIGILVIIDLYSTVPLCYKDAERATLWIKCTIIQ
jgi:hypothetical protein